MLIRGNLVSLRKPQRGTEVGREIERLSCSMAETYPSRLILLFGTFIIVGADPVWLRA